MSNSNFTSVQFSAYLDYCKPFITLASIILISHYRSIELSPIFQAFPQNRSGFLWQYLQLEPKQYQLTREFHSWWRMKNSQPYTQSKFYTNSRSQPFNQHQSNEGCVARILSSKSHYSTLGVDSTCSSPGIKRAYRQLALACHPDRNKTPGAVRAFQAVGRAYEVLSDRDLRRQYDRTLVEERRKMMVKAWIILCLGTLHSYFDLCAFLWCLDLHVLCIW